MQRTEWLQETRRMGGSLTGEASLYPQTQVASRHTRAKGVAGRKQAGAGRQTVAQTQIQLAAALLPWPLADTAVARAPSEPPHSVTQAPFQQDAVLRTAARGGSVSTRLLQPLTGQSQSPLLTQAQTPDCLAQTEDATQ